MSKKLRAFSNEQTQSAARSSFRRVGIAVSFSPDMLLLSVLKWLGKKTVGI